MQEIEKMSDIKICGVTFTFLYTSEESPAQQERDLQQIEYELMKKRGMIDEKMSEIFDTLPVKYRYLLDDNTFEQNISIDFKSAKKNSFQSHEQSLKNIEQSLTQMEKCIKKSEDLTKWDKVKQFKAEMTKLTDLSQTIKNEMDVLYNVIKEVTSEIKNMTIRLEENMRELKEVEDNLVSRRGEQKQLNELESMKTRKYNLQREIHQIEKDIQQKRKEYNKLRKKININEDLMKEMFEATYRGLQLVEGSFDNQICTLEGRSRQHQTQMQNSYRYINTFFIPLIRIVRQIESGNSSLSEIRALMEGYKTTIQQHCPRTGKIRFLI